jgi:L-seryl-tRNA(Ser) seleniumtransferase
MAFARNMSSECPTLGDGRSNPDLVPWPRRVDLVACPRCGHDASLMAEPARSLAQLPSIEKVVACPAGQRLVGEYARTAVVAAARTVLDELRVRMRAPAAGAMSPADLKLDAVAERTRALLCRQSRRRSERVINATGVVLHTNLGRALLAPSAIAAAAEAAGAPIALEFDVEHGRRGDRDALVEEHLVALTGAEAATVVNNNAAAVLLALNSLAEGREVVVSRGELIEIGGSFRIPEVMAKSGALLREVGTTNRTHARDYRDAIGPATALLLKVHTSNYRIVGFTAAVDLVELRAIASEHEGVVVMEDLGAGALVDLAAYGLPREPVVRERLETGADVVTFSGDKLLGGPQCGVIAGRAALIERVRRNPLKRALRCDKMTLAALEETLRIYRFDPAPERVLPTLRVLVRPIDEIERVGAEAVALLERTLGSEFRVTLERSSAQTGSGSQPEVELESRALAITSDRHSPDAIATRFRASEPPIIGRIERDRFLLDVRAIDDPAALVPSAS